MVPIASFIGLIAHPQHFPYDREDEAKGAQTPWDLRWGKVGLLFEKPFTVLPLLRLG